MCYTKTGFMELVEKDARNHTQYESSRNFSIFPFKDKETGKYQRSAAVIFSMKHITKVNHTHTVIVAYKDSGYYIWCGDNFISGRNISKTEANLISVRLAKTKQEKIEIMKLFSSSQNQPCCFWRDKTCQHVNNALACIKSNPSLLDKLEENFFLKTKIYKDRSPEELLIKLSFKKHVLLRGDKGVGKTYIAGKIAKALGVRTFFIGGNKSIEASDFIGEYIPMSIESDKKENLFSQPSSQISMVWKDGPLSQAFRYAAAGNKAIFIVDEMLRIHNDELSPLVSALSPDDNGKYKLGTKRALSVKDGIANEEILECDTSNLWVIATTNIGASYSVGEMDEALADRLRIVNVHSEESTVRKILTKEIAKNKYSSNCINPMMLFYELFEKQRADGVFKKILNQRHLKEAVQCSEDENDIKESLWEIRNAWIDVDIDGKLRPDQENKIKKSLDKAYS